MKKLNCDRCHINIGISESNRDGRYYDVRRSSEYSRFGHKHEKYICESCMQNDERYKKENELVFS